MKEACINNSHLIQSKKNELFFQPKLSVNQPNDFYEQEADAVAEKVIQSKTIQQSETFFKPVSISSIQRKCAHCEEEEKLQRKEENGNETEISESFEHYVDGLNNGGTSLPPDSKSFFESRIGYDFSNVKIHTDAVAAKSAQSINALAYTSGNNIVFNQNQFQPGTTNGDKLIAHELTHVVQQSGNIQTKLIQKQGMGDVRIAEGFHEVESRILATAAYTGAPVADQQDTRTIITRITTRYADWPSRLRYITRLLTLFELRENPPAVVAAETRTETTRAVTAERTRVAAPVAAANLTLEETASARAGRVWTPIAGRFGGGTYFVDRTDPRNIVIRAKVFLSPAGSGTAADVANVRAMEDGIEKAASTTGFLVDVIFVDVPDAETFRAVVDPSRWEDATNWSGGEPRGFAHELLHMFAFDIDRYNYIDAHATNASMVLHDRLHWFLEQLNKPDGWDNDLSIMGYGPHPLEDDVCRVAGLDIATCMATRAATP